MNARFLVELAEVMGVAIEQLKHGNIRQRAIGAHLAEYKKEVIMLSQTWRDPVDSNGTHTNGEVQSMRPLRTRTSAATNGLARGPERS